ncbi:MAG TPA: hypothetical protein VIV14_10940 [Gammaproteobacteria bacterium]
MTIARNIRFVAVAATGGLAAAAASAYQPATQDPASGSLEVIEVVEERPVIEDFGELAFERVADRLVATKLEQRSVALREAVRATFEQAASELDGAADDDREKAEERVAANRSRYDDLPAPVVGIEEQRGPVFIF